VAVAHESLRAGKPGDACTDDPDSHSVSLALAYRKARWTAH
jgi:hypothetical protein